jgi:hypothetical protein
MIRVLLAAAILAVLVLGSRADDRVVRLSVQPMPAPKPALKYVLLPEIRELKLGNPVQWYIRCFQEQRHFFFNKAANAERARYRSMPLSEVPSDKLKNYGGGALTQADWGARLDTPNWEILERVQSEGTALRLPELEPLQILGVALQVRFRGDVAGRRFDDAIETAKTMFALARHLGQCPVGRANRLGLAIAGLALDTLEEMLQQPGCPNLCWALTNLPCPLVDLRKGLQGDGVLSSADLRRVKDQPMSETEIEEAVSRLSGTIGYAREHAGRPPRNLRMILREGANNPNKLSAARARLIEAGASEQQVRKLPAIQVLLLDAKHEYEIQRDERVKLLPLAPWQIARLTTNVSGQEANGLFADLLPEVVKIRHEQARLEQRLGLLRHVEALRLYAAAHDGKLPTKLSDFSLPVPDDPFTGKPFRYEVDGQVAHLRGGPTDDRAKAPTGEVHYQVTMK